MRLYLRTFFIQSLLNYRWMQGNAFRYVLRLNRVEESGAIPFFNTHPWLAPGIIALIARLRSEQAEPRETERVRLRWMGTLGAVGDGVFWSTFRPMAVILSFVVLIVQPYFFWLIPVLFWCFSLLVRWQALRAGRGGEELFFLWLERMRPRQVISVSHKVLFPLIYLLGMALPFVFLERLGPAVGLDRLFWTALWMGLTIVVLLLRSRNKPTLPVLLVASLLYIGWYYIGV